MKNRVIALLLSAAMVVTMVPGNCVLVKAEEVPEVAVTEINADQEEAPDQEDASDQKAETDQARESEEVQDVAAENEGQETVNYIEWKIDEATNTLTFKDKTTAYETKEYETEKFEDTEITLPKIDKSTHLATHMYVDGYEYEWFVKGEEGYVPVQYEEEDETATDEYLDLTRLGYDLTNDNASYDFKCEVKVKSMYRTENDTENDKVYETVPENGTKLSYEVSVKYKKATDKAGYKLEDYFTVTNQDAIADKTITFTTADGQDVSFLEANDKGVMPSVMAEAADITKTPKFITKWTAVFTDKSEEPLNTEEQLQPADEPLDFTARPFEWVVDKEGKSILKQVDHYRYELDLCNGYEVLQHFERNIKAEVNPLVNVKSYINNKKVKIESDEQGNPKAAAFDARENETVDLKVSLEELDKGNWDEYFDLEGTLYQWYSYDKDNKATLLKNQTADTLSVKVKDEAGFYCAITLKGQGYIGYLKDAYKGTTVSFKVNNKKSGYFLVKQADQNQYAALGTEKTLYSDVTVDEGYAVTYEWFKYTPSYDKDGDYSTSEWKKVEDAGDSSLAVAFDQKEEYSTNDSFQYATGKKDADDNPEYINGDERANYYQVVTVKDKSENIVDRVLYPFTISENPGYSIKTNAFYVNKDRKDLRSGEKGCAVYKSDDANSSRQPVTAFDEDSVYDLKENEAKTIEFSKEEENGRYHVGATLYQVVAVSSFHKASHTTDDGKSEEKAYYDDADFVMPNQKAYDRVYIVEDQPTTYISSVDGTVRTANNVKYFLKKVKSTDSKVNALDLTVAGTLDKGIEQYMYVYTPAYTGTDKKTQNLYEYNEGALLAVFRHPETEKEDEPVEEESSNLIAYVKNDVVTGRLGEEAVLEVVADNDDQKKYPISYQWAKLEKGGDYTDIKGATDKVLKFDKLKDEDYTDYRVTVKDKSQKTIELSVRLEKEYDDSVDLTPDKTKYIKNIGDKVTFKAALLLDDTAKVSDINYKWYMIKREGRNDYSSSYDQYESAEYELTGVNADSYTITVTDDTYLYDYYCVASYAYESADMPKDKWSNYKKSFMYQVYEEEPYTELEALSRTAFTKNVGETVTMSARLVSNDKQLDLNKVTYKWFKDGVEIPDASTAAYAVKLDKEDDFNTYTLKVYDAEGKLIDYIDYTVRCNYEVYVEYEDESYVYAKKGSDVTLAPKILNADNLDLTYKWKCTTEDGTRYTITGADQPAYTIERIGENESGNIYTLAIYYKDALVNSITYTIDEVWTADEYTGIDLEGDDYEFVMVSRGQDVTLKVKAVNYDKKEPLYYQWYTGSPYDYYHNAIGDATSDTYVIKNVLQAQTVFCKVINKKGAAETKTFRIGLTNDFNLEEESAIAKETRLGQNVTLKANASAADPYDCVYQWYKYNEEFDVYVKIPGATKSEYTVKAVKMEDLGNYKCEVSCQDEIDTIRYRVYVPTELVVEASPYAPVVNADGTITMYVKARAASYEHIKYLWERPDNDSADEDIEITSNKTNTFTIKPLKSTDYGAYTCYVSTEFGEKEVDFHVYPRLTGTQSRKYAEPGDKVTFGAEVINPASDLAYRYTWYMKELYKNTDEKLYDRDIEGSHNDNFAATSYRDVKLDCTASTLTAELPKPGALDDNSCQTVSYYCVITAESKDGETVYDTSAIDYDVNVFDNLTTSSTYPETDHPAERCSTKKYASAGADSLTVTFDEKSDFLPDQLYLLDKNGKKYYPCYYDHMKDLQDEEYYVRKTITIPGDEVIFVYNTDDLDSKLWYGYKVAEIHANKEVKPAPTPNPDPTPTPAPAPAEKPAQNTGTGTKPGTESEQKEVLKEGSTVKGADGATYTVGTENKVTYSVADKTAKGTVSIPNTVVLNEKEYKVEAVADNAFKGNKKITKVTLGSNVKKVGKNAFSGCTKLKTVSMGSVTKIDAKAFYKCTALKKVVIPASVTNIGKSAFEGCKNLKTIQIKTTKLTKKTVGAKAFKGTNAKAKVKVPKKKLKVYKTLLRAKGISKKAKITK